MQEEYRLEADDRVLQKTPCSFDVSVWEFFWPLLTGARLACRGAGWPPRSAYLSRLIRDELITTPHFVPSMLRCFEQEGLEASCIASPDHLQRRGRCHLVWPIASSAACRELHNLYGPAEAAVDVTFWQCRPDPDATTVPIGRPIANLSMFLLDPHGRLVPGGTPGELYIGGVGV
jgi:non-ribosomal peptide synthetase component F